MMGDHNTLGPPTNPDEYVPVPESQEYLQGLLYLTPYAIKYLWRAVVVGLKVWAVIMTASFIEFCAIHACHYLAHFIGGK